jgi:hypothetical protein
MSIVIDRDIQNQFATSVRLVYRCRRFYRAFSYLSNIPALKAWLLFSNVPYFLAYLNGVLKTDQNTRAVGMV